MNYGYEEMSVLFPEHGQCFLYVASESHIDESLVLYTWYKELVIAGLEYHQFPRDYIDRVWAVADQIDEDTQRHQKNMAIVESARIGA